MAISKVEIINKALVSIGANPITNIDDDTQNARVISRVYEISLRSILSECKWNFATTRKLLTQSTDTLDWYFTQDGETYIYSKPNDIVRIFGTNDDDSVWREEGDLIISDTQGLGIIYVRYLDNPAKYSASFIEALSDKLASDAAYMILNSASKGQEMYEKYQSVSLPKAMSENSQIGKQQYLKDDAWERSKYQDGNPIA